MSVMKQEPKSNKSLQWAILAILAVTVIVFFGQVNGSLLEFF